MKVIHVALCAGGLALSIAPARAANPENLLAVTFGGGAIQALSQAESGHAVAMGVEFGCDWWRVGGVAGVVYPGGRIQTRAAFYGLTGRASVVRFAESLTLDVTALAGGIASDAAVSRASSPAGLPSDAVRWASSGSVLLSGGAGLRWLPGVPGFFLDLEGRLVNLSHFGLFFGTGLTF